jgi:hypothetical protein
VNPRLGFGLLLLTALTLADCATAPSCTPAVIVVTERERRTRIGLEPGTPWSTETGQIRQPLHESFVPEYWLKDTRGHWYQVSEATWRVAEVGRPIEVCH